MRGASNTTLYPEYSRAMLSNLPFPIRRVSVRVPWHDAGWNGPVCNDPENNTACLKLPRIAEKKDQQTARHALKLGIR